MAIVIKQKLNFVRLLSTFGYDMLIICFVTE
jgi:hypothetical protein